MNIESQESWGFFRHHISQHIMQLRERVGYGDLNMYVTVKRINRNDDVYTFIFECDSEHGILELDASIGKIELIKPMEGRNGNQNYFRARSAILRELAKGIVPIETFFASS